MKIEKSSSLSRRRFITSASGLLAGPALLSFPAWAGIGGRSIQETPVEMSPQELEWVKKSKMAEELIGYFTGGYSCAESILMVALRFIGQSEDNVWAAAGYGGGVQHKELCGFLTGGVMGIGYAAGSLKMDREAAKKLCGKAVNQYWDWWMTIAPLRCGDIRKPGVDPKVCRRLGRLASAKAEELIKTLKA